MGRHVITTKFGSVVLKVHRHEGGWLPVLVGQHSVPYVPRINGGRARCERDALELVAEAIERLEAY